MKKMMTALCAAALASAVFAEETPPAPCGCQDGAECKCAPCECKKAECPKPPCAPCECKKAECPKPPCPPCECKKAECPKPPCPPCECKKPGCDEKKFQRPPAIFLDAKTDPAAVEAFKKSVMERIDKAVADAAAENAAPIRVMLIVNDRAPNRGPAKHSRLGKGRRGRPGAPQADGDGATPPPPADMPPPAEAPAPDAQ
jgi:hypothetical protein